MKKYFVTGTDTEVGKTFSSCRLLEEAHRQGMSTLGLKPVAAGCEMLDSQMKNEDALALIEASSVKLPYAQVNPVALETACSPHIAASISKKAVSASRLTGYVRGALMSKVDFALVEGAGGWRVPISPRETMADLAKELGYPVIMVVGMKLGCLNHSLLTAEAIRNDGLVLAGWIANQQSSDQMSCFDENVHTLRQAINAPCLGVLPHQSGSVSAEFGKYIHLDCLTV